MCEAVLPQVCAAAAAPAPGPAGWTEPDMYVCVGEVFSERFNFEGCMALRALRVGFVLVGHFTMHFTHTHALYTSRHTDTHTHSHG